MPKRQELYEMLLAKKGILPLEEQPIIRVSEPGPYQLSFGQQRFYFLDEFGKGASTYNTPIAVEINGVLDVRVLKCCFVEVIQRHEILRTVFYISEGEPCQSVRESMPFFIEEIDLADNPGITDKNMKKMLAAFAKVSFELSTGPLIKATLYKIESTRYILLINMHHIITDNWSTGILVQEIITLYKAFSQGQASPLKDLPFQYKDYALWQRNRLQKDSLQKEIEYWKRQLAGAPPLLELPLDKPRPPIQGDKGTFIEFSIPQETLSKLKLLAKSEGASLFMILLASFKVLLYRYTGQNDLSVGTPIAGRTRQEVEYLIGLFINSLVIRTSFASGITFRQLIQKVKDIALEAYANQSIPFEKLVEEFNPRRNMSYSPLFQVMFVMQNAPIPPVELPGLRIRSIPIDSEFAQFDLSITVWEKDNMLRGTLEYNSDLFYPDTAERMVNHYCTLTREAVINPDLALEKLELLTNIEKRQLLKEWRGYTQDYPHEECIHQLFRKQAADTPNNIAFIYKDVCLYYHELDKKSDMLAQILSEAGATRGKIVGICIDYSPELLIAMLGILKSGAAYLPIEVDCPKERLDYIIKDTGVLLFLTTGRQSSLLAESGVPFLVIDEELKKDMGISDSIKDNCSSQDLACIIYTSGSTGLPKGVMLEHKGIVNLITSFISSYQVDAEDRILPVTSMASASFVGETLPMLCCGGSIVLASKNALLDYDNLMAMIRDYNITIISTVPAMVARLNAGKINLPKLRLILCGGEALLPRDVINLIETTKVVNGYGLTEATVCSTYHIVDKKDLQQEHSISLGKPIMNNQIYILDQHMNLMPVGCPGEIYIAGDGLARGYINHQSLTQERFLENPFVKGSRMYRTGDLACWQADGTIKYRGRADRQVKIRGYRIELGEIEACIQRHPAVLQAVLKVWEDVANEKRLAAYVVMQEKENISLGEIKRWLSDKLPEHMIPQTIDILPFLSLNDNGKVDLESLPEPGWRDIGDEKSYQLPRTETEKMIEEVWKEALGRADISINDNFFDIGGHSMLLMRVHERLKTLFGKDLSIVDMFRYPTIFTLAEHLSGEMVFCNTFDAVLERAKKQREAFIKQQQLKERRKM